MDVQHTRVDLFSSFTLNGLFSLAYLRSSYLLELVPIVWPLFELFPPCLYLYILIISTTHSILNVVMMAGIICFTISSTYMNALFVFEVSTSNLWTFYLYDNCVFVCAFVSIYVCVFVTDLRNNFTVYKMPYVQFCASSKKTCIKTSLSIVTQLQVRF